MHQLPTDGTSFDPGAYLNELRAAGITAVDELLRAMHDRQQVPVERAVANQPEFERRLRESTMAVEREFHTHDLERLVTTAKGLVVDGVRYVAQAPSNLHVLLMSGWVVVRRPLFRARGGHGGETIDPLASQVGLVGGSTSMAAAQVIAKHAVSVPETEAAEMMKIQGGLQPSGSHVGRVMKALGAVVEAQRTEIEEAIRVSELVEQRLPACEVVDLIVWSLDGIMVRMKDAPNTPGAKKTDDGPKGHREAASATVALYDSDGRRLHTIALARMPEFKKVTLQAQLMKELEFVIERYPSARLQVVADAARENWRIVDEIEAKLKIRSIRAVDCMHAKDHLTEALKLSGASRTVVNAYKDILFNDPDGANRCLAELVRRRQFKMFENNTERARKLDAEITYFNNNGKMMNYPALRAARLATASGVQEAACKTLIGQRLKCSGMSWLQPGGQAILTFRSFDKSDRFDLAWRALQPRLRQPVDTFQTDPDNKPQRPSWSQGLAA